MDATKTQKKENADMDVNVRLARRIKAMRALRGMTQKDLADACGASNQTICNIETGKADWKVSTMRKIEIALQCTLILIPNEDLI